MTLMIAVAPPKSSYSLRTPQPPHCILQSKNLELDFDFPSLFLIPHLCKLCFVDFTFKIPLESSHWYSLYDCQGPIISLVNLIHFSSSLWAVELQLQLDLLTVALLDPQASQQLSVFNPILLWKVRSVVLVSASHLFNFMTRSTIQLFCSSSSQNWKHFESRSSVCL